MDSLIATKAVAFIQAVLMFKGYQWTYMGVCRESTGHIKREHQALSESTPIEQANRLQALN